MSLLQRIDFLFEVDVVWWELGLHTRGFMLAGQFDALEDPLPKVRTLSSTCPNCSLVNWKVRDANGVICAPMPLRKMRSAHSPGKSYFLLERLTTAACSNS